MTPQTSSNPMDALLRARLRIPQGANRRLKALRIGLQGLDGFSRLLTGRAFFALREAEEVLRYLDGRTGPDLVRAMLAYKGSTTITARGLDRIPGQGGVIIASTHPVGTFDFLAHAAVLFDLRPDLKVVANREAERFLGKDRIIAVDLDRSDRVLTARQTHAGMLRHLKSGGALLVFGSGRVAHRIKGRLVEPAWRPGASRLSSAAGTVVIPASPNMRNSGHYYWTRTLAQALSGGNEYIGREIASFRYSSELIAKLGGTYEVHYGPPQPPGTPPDTLKQLAEGLVPGLYGPV